MSRLCRLVVGPALLALGLLATAAQGQELGGVPEEGGSGNPAYGYALTSLIACATLFVLCKSSRR